jgi:hypothetical protein
VFVGFVNLVHAIWHGLYILVVIKSPVVEIESSVSKGIQMFVQKSIHIFVLAQELVLIQLLEVFEVGRHLLDTAAGLRKNVVLSSNDSTAISLNPVISGVLTPVGLGVACSIRCKVGHEPSVAVGDLDWQHRYQIYKRHQVLSKKIWKRDESLFIRQETQISADNPVQKDDDTHANDGCEELEAVRAVTPHLQDQVLIEQSPSLVADLCVEVGFLV